MESHYRFIMGDQLEIEAVEDEDLSTLESPKNQKKTSPWMTKYEYTRLLGQRTLQIMQGDPPRIETHGMMDPYQIAVEELRQRRTPLSIKRTLPNGEVETWKVSKMHIRNH